MRHAFQAKQWLPYPVPLVFSFFANPENLPRLMPPWQKARIEEASFAPPPPRPLNAEPARAGAIAAGVGTKMTISFRPFPFSPIRVPWDAEIDEFVWNDHFCDTQLRGPFAFWHHCHRLSAESRTDETGQTSAGTLIHDEVHYEMHFGPLGELAQRLFIDGQFRKTFEYRQKRTAELIPIMQSRT